MSKKLLEPISVRTTRINHLILGNSKATSKTNKSTADAISREGLLDAFYLLYNECDKEQLKRRDKNIQEFITKYRPVIDETKSLRINNDDFSVKAIIGKGYFGTVHLVTEKTTGDVYAMKKIKKSVITTSQVKEERDIMAQRNSEWITNLQYAFQDSDCLYLIMEYLPGGDLLSLMIRNGSFEEDLTKFYLAELTIAINALHQMGYVHRDIKPENILIDRFGHIKLADFGNAAALNKDGNVISLSPVGTPDYIAPELLQTISSFKLSKSTHDVNCDYWSMGIIGYELVCETTPFHEENVHETYSKILTHCEDSHSKEIISFPIDLKLTEPFKNLIQRLVTKPTQRIGYAQIRKHPFFDGIKWDTLRQQVPPIIPNVNSDDDLSNFEDVERNKGRRSTFVKKSPSTTNIKSNEFSGQDLPFLGYGFIYHHDDKGQDNSNIEVNNLKINKLNMKIKDLQTVMKSQTDEIRCLQENLLKAEQKAKQSDSVSKILTEAKEELNKMKESLKQKTIELASCKTEIKTLQNSLKIDEEMRLKNDDTISEILRSTYQKWEKAKTASDQNYEKQIAEKKTEIINITENLKQRDNELTAKNDECKHLHDKLGNYKEMLKSIKDQAIVDKQEFEKNKSELTAAYETKIIEMRNKLKMEKDTKNRLTYQLRDVQTELDESICSTNSNKQAKLVIDKNIQEIKQRLTREIELNNTLRSENANIEKIRNELEKTCENLRAENEKLQKEVQLFECTQHLGSTLSSPYHTASGSLTELHGVEEQLRNDLTLAKENEDLQRKRADQLEKAVTKLETIIVKISEQPPKSVGVMLEKQNEKLEDQLATTRDQMVLERQSARTANLGMWKLEKQVDDLQHEKKIIQRRMELTEDKIKKIQNERADIERSLKEAQSDCKQKDSRIKELKEEIIILKLDVQKEHKMWEKAEQERMKEKSEILEHVSEVHKLEEKLQDTRQKLQQSQKKHDGLSLENIRLLREVNEERDRATTSNDSLAEIQMKLKNTESNYEMLKVACNITDSQLTEIEVMLDTEMKRNKTNQEKIEQLNKKVREKDEQIGQLKKNVNTEVALKISAEEKMKNLKNEIEDLRKNSEISQAKIISQQSQLIEYTNDLFAAQEKLELISSESNNLQTMNENHNREIIILKEEGAKLLTELFHTKEEVNRLSHELKESQQTIIELNNEIEQLNGTLVEQKNHYIQRDIKSEATLAQHKKLIDYLQVKVEDLSSQKKKKSFAGMIFGSSTTNSKKENISPNVIETSILYRTLQEELKREKQRNKTLQERLDNYNSNIIQENTVPRAKNEQATVSYQSSQKQSTVSYQSKANEVALAAKTNTIPKRTEPTRISTSSDSSNRRRTYQTHRFELTLETVDSIVINCLACHKQILTGSPCWKCKECKGAAHRRCRADVNTSCDGIEMIHEPPEKDIDSVPPLQDNVKEEVLGNFIKGYHGDFLCTALDNEKNKMEINCAFEMSENIILFGSNSGLFAYHRDSGTMVHISGIESVNYIAVTTALSKAILVGSNGEYLYQCDLRHLYNRSQANACLKPKLEASILDLPFANRAHNEKWHLVKISDHHENAIETIAIAATSTRIVIMKYDLNLQRFKPVRALDTATSVSSILFTRHTAIVGSDKFFEIDLTSYSAEEFIDLSDPSMSHTRTLQPTVVFRISPQEFLLCFVECGIFVDEYGCRSRPYDINWEYIPTGFMYREPFLYISHFQIVQVLRIYRSYKNEIANTSNTEITDSDDDITQEPNFKRTYLNLYMPTLLAESGNKNCWVLAINKEHGEQEIYCLNGLKALKENLEVSMETLSSEATCVTLGSATSTDTL